MRLVSRLWKLKFVNWNENTDYENTWSVTSSELRNKRSHIRETKHLPTNADSSTNNKKYGKISKNKTKKIVRGNFTLFIKKKFNLRQLFPLIFHKHSENLKSLYIGLWALEAIWHLNGVNKLRETNSKKLVLIVEIWLQEVGAQRPLNGHCEMKVSWF